MKTDLSKEQLPWWLGIAAFIVILLALFAFQMILAVLVIVTGNPNVVTALLTPPGLIAQVAFMALALLVVSFGVPKLFGVSIRSVLGFQRTPEPTYAAALLGVIGVGFLVDEVTFLLHSLSPALFDASGLALFNSIFIEASPGWFVLITIAVSLGPGFGEEIFFRGFALRTFRPHMPAWAAVLISSFMFGLIHFDWLQSPGAGLIGIYLGFVTLATRSIWPAVAAHALNNLVCALFARFGGAAVSRVWETGHSPWLLMAATLLTAASIAVLVRLRESESASPATPE